MKDSRMMFGFLLLVLLAVLAGVIAIGHVHEETSFGLQYILGALSTLAGGFAQWAFSKNNTPQNSNPKGGRGESPETESSEMGQAGELARSATKP
jgi:hypothetical protein